MKILAISGSLRKASANTAMLQAAIAISSKVDGVEMSLYPPEDLEAIPHFNPDRDVEGVTPNSVLKFRIALNASDGVLIASPEYVGGVSGLLKNSFDWVVSSDALEVYEKPFAVLNLSNRATEADDDLKRIIKTMGGNVIDEASIQIPLKSNVVTTDGLLKNPYLMQKLEKILQEFSSAILRLRPNGIV